MYKNVVEKAEEKAFPDEKENQKYVAPKAAELPDYKAVPEYTPAPIQPINPSAPPVS